MSEINLIIKYENDRYQIYDNKGSNHSSLTFDGVVYNLSNHVLSYYSQKKVKLDCDGIFPNKEKKRLESIINAHNTLVSARKKN